MPDYSSTQSARDDPSASVPNRRTGFWTSPVASFWIAVVLVVAASILALMQWPRPDALRPPRWIISMEWWRYPLEWNAANRLPRVKCDLNAIYAVPNSTSIWAVGNKGMVVNSSDGRNWTKKTLAGARPAPVASPDVSPSPLPTRQSPTQSFFRLPDLIPTAQAMSVATPPAQQGTPPPARNPSPTPSPFPGPTTIVLPQPSPENEQLIAVHFMNDDRGETVDRLGWRYETQDGGGNWTRQTLTKNLATPNPLTLKFLFNELPLRSLQLPPSRWLSDPSQLEQFQVVTNSGTIYALLTDGVGPFFLSQPFENVNAAYMLPFEEGKDNFEGRIWVVASGGQVYRSRVNPSSWQPFTTGTLDDLHGVYFLNSNRGWVVGSNGAIFTTSDSGTDWIRQISGTTSQLNAVHFLFDGRYGWIAGNDGLILSTEDGGTTWVHRTQGSKATGPYLRFPAPWYFLALFLVGLLVWRRPQVAEAPPEESVADVLVSDRPLDEATGDVLAFNPIARGLSQFLRNENTMPPLTIAITGEWGTGKSSLMNLLRADLRSYKFRPVWFNAWHHQKEEHMLASLLENIKLQAVPRWWTTRGVLFRARLLKIRGVRHWGPVVLLVFFIYVMVLYHLGQHGSESDFSNSIKNFANLFSEKPSSESFGQSVITLVPLIVAVLTFLGALLRGITAFGVKPASLLAGISRGINIRGLEAQTSFRQKFAVQFNDVTRALGRRSLLIFIDDLDRCRPENVLETLEAVNFLTTSGECFVVIGMAREYVERCVGRAFNEVAQEMVDDLPPELKESPEDIAKQKRIEFARQYLDKLVNIEVPVPAPKQSQSLALLVASTRQLEISPATSSLQQFKLSIANSIEHHWRFFPALLIAVGLIVLGYYLARGLAGTSVNETANSSSETSSPSPVSSVSPSPVASVAPSPTPAATGSATPLPTATPTLTPDKQSPVVVPGERAFVSPGLAPLLSLLVLIWLGSAILSRRPGLIVKDSPKFIAALEIWHPLVFARQATPRATKRFMNFVRYLAMRQRRGTDSQPPIKKFVSQLKERLVGVRSIDEVTADAAEMVSDVQQIPDEVLVALAALQHLNPECLSDQPGPASSPDKVWPRAISATNLLGPLFEKARNDHEAEFHNWATLSLYRERFLEMTANVQVR